MNAFILGERELNVAYCYYCLMNVTVNAFILLSVHYKKIQRFMKLQN